ncbi:MAG: hypothetical protein AAGF56_01645 [Pseudomonadota bacterium]
MLYEQVRFTVERPELGPSPVRLDVTMFLGLLAVRPDAKPSEALQERWRRDGYLKHDQVAQSAEDLVDRPVPVSSLAEAESLFALDQRVDRPAVITSGAIRTPILGLDIPLGVALDGVLQEIDLAGAPDDLEGLATFVNVRLKGVSVRVDGDRIVFSRSSTTTAGTLSVLGYPALGFAKSLHVRAKPVDTATGAALRQFFDTGGRQAVIVSLGQPPAGLSEAEPRAAQLARLLDMPADGIVDATSFAADFKAPHIAATERSGLSHLFGAEDVGQLVMPDLCDLVSGPRVAKTDLPDELRPTAEFAACLPPDLTMARGQAVDVGRAQLDDNGRALWSAALGRITTFLAAYRRDVGMIAAVPEASEALPFSPHLTLAGPWVRTPRSDRLPGGVMGADAVVAGHLARHLGGPDRHGSIAAAPLQQIRSVDPSARIPGVCWILKGPRDFRLTGDVTTDVGGLWAKGPARRIMARLLKEADRMGPLFLFEPISDALMARVGAVFSAVLDDIRVAGGLLPSDQDPGYQVICNRTNNTAADRDKGRLRAEVGFRPAPAITMIKVSLNIGNQGGGA